MSKYIALGFRSHEDFELCRKVMNIKMGDTGTSVDGLFTVLIETVRILVPDGVLVHTCEDGRRIFIRVTSGTTVE